MIEELFGLQGRIALVTGGYGHLGRAMSEVLAAAGAKVYCAGRSEEQFRKVFSKIPEKISFLPLDLQKKASYQRALAQLPHLDILVNNAFYLSDTFENDMHGLLHAHVDLTESALSQLARSNRGRIINIASMYGMVAPDPDLYRDHPQFRSRASYNAAKAALLQLTKYWASFWGEAHPKLTVNAISPGPFPQKDIAPNFAEKLKQRTILKRLGEPEDLAGALLLLSSRAGDYITAHNLVVDGGWTAR